MSNQFKWTDDAVKQFARVYAAGRTGKYKKARKIDDKLNIFKKEGWSMVSSKTQKRGRPSKTLLIDKAAFLDWYFSADVMRDFARDHAIPLVLLTKGRFLIRAEDILKNCWYLPVDVVHKSMADSVKTYDSDEVDTSYYTIYKFVS